MIEKASPSKGLTVLVLLCLHLSKTECKPTMTSPAGLSTQVWHCGCRHLGFYILIGSDRKPKNTFWLKLVSHKVAISQRIPCLIVCFTVNRIIIMLIKT